MKLMGRTRRHGLRRRSTAEPGGSSRQAERLRCHAGTRRSSFKGYAVNSYASAVRYLANQEVSVELFAPKPNEPTSLVRGKLPVGRAQREAAILDRRPTIVTEEELFEGQLESRS